MAAPAARWPGMALRAHKFPVGVHGWADERRAGHHSGPAQGAGAFRAPDEPARRSPAARGARAGAPGARARAGAPGARGWREPVTVAAVLLGYAAGAGTLGARILGRAAWM